jgi:hypothetical protein
MPPKSPQSSARSRRQTWEWRFFVASVMTILALALVGWWYLRLASGSAATLSPARPSFPLQRDAETANAPKPRFAEDPTSLATERVDLVALATIRLREWSDDDDPEKREARTAHLEQIFFGRGETAERQLAVLEQLPPELRDFAFGLPSFQKWMFAHPADALAWMSEHVEISEARVLTVLQDWNENDHEEYRRYLDALPESEWKQKVLVAASHQALADDPATAIAHAQQLRSAELRTGLLELATKEWARRDAEAAGLWVGEVPDLKLQEQLRGALAVGYADIAPEFAAGWIVATLPPGKTLERSAAEIAGAWARQDPAAAAAWIERFPEGEMRQLAVGNLLNAWTDRDCAAALAWARDRPDAALRAEAEIFVGPKASP